MKNGWIPLLFGILVACAGGDDGGGDGDDTTCVPACPVGSSCAGGACVTKPDTGVSDSGASDTGRTDGGAGDSGAPADSGESDAGGNDAGDSDSGEHADAAAPDADLPAVASLTVTPTTALLVSYDGSEPSAVFEATAIYTDGSTLAVTGIATWEVDPIVIGAMDPATGTFTANGQIGGPGRLIATFDGVAGEAAITVRLEETVLTPGTSTNTPMLFDVPGIVDPTREALTVYPLDGSVMPQNVPPAEIQWLRSAPGDVFRVTFAKPNVLLTGYVSQSAPGYRDSWLVELDGWRRVAQSEPQNQVFISVDRYIAGTQEVVLGTPVAVRFPRAALLGSVYYWDIARGRIVRINDGTTVRDEFMPSPQQGCIGCHSVSSSGRYMAGRLGGGDNVGAVYDLTQNLTVSPPPTVWPVTSTTARWFFSDWSPDDSRLVITYGEQGGARGLNVLDPFNGRPVPPVAGTLPTGSVTHPAWSPDGTAIAYVSDTNNWGGANSTGNIYVLPIVGLDEYGAPLRVMTGTTPPGLPAGSAANYPTWTPDAEWIAFAHGNSSRSETGQSALYLMRRDGTDLVRLDNASGGPNGVVSFQPRFSPFEQDGYFWLTFLSRRDYGNGLAGTRGTSRQQIWVAAIRTSPQPGQDASEVPYWLPGQSTGSLNISAYWAPRACRSDFEACTVDAECCNGDCAANAAGDLVCVPGSGVCGQPGDPCTNHDQCCNGVLCVDATCGGL